jgi:replicative DNA helicase
LTPEAAQEMAATFCGGDPAAVPLLLRAFDGNPAEKARARTAINALWPSVFGAIEKEILNAPKRRRHLWQGIKGALSEIDRFSAGDFSGRVPLGVPALDKRLRGGLKGGQLTLLGSPTGSGKTALVQQLAVSAARATGRPVFFASPEMSLESLAEREIIRESRTRLWDVSPWRRDAGARTQAQQQMAYAASKLLTEKLAIIVMEDLDPNMADIVAAVMEEHARTPLALVVIDYAQYVAGDAADSRTPRYLQVGEVAKGSVALARKLDVPVLVTAQVNITREKGGKPTYTWRESAELEKPAHNALILDVDWKFDERGTRYVEGARLLATKIRDSGGFVQEVKYEPHIYRVSDPGEPEATAAPDVWSADK